MRLAFRHVHGIIDINFFVIVTGRRVEHVPKIQPLGKQPRFFREFPRGARFGAFPLVDFSRGDFEQFFAVSVAELFYERNAPFLYAQHARPARMLDHLALARLAVGKHGVVAAQRNDFSAVYVILVDGFFGQIHKTALPFP